MKVVRHKITGRLVYRQQPDFEVGLGITNAVSFGCGSADELEEVEVTEAEWEAELITRQGEHLPHSEHIGKLISVNPALAKPATVRRRYLGINHDVNCLVTQNIVNMWTANPKELNIDDFVLVSFIDETPNETEKNAAIATDKVYESW